MDRYELLQYPSSGEYFAVLVREGEAVAATPFLDWEEAEEAMGVGLLDFHYDEEPPSDWREARPVLVVEVYRR